MCVGLFKINFAIKGINLKIYIENKYIVLKYLIFLIVLIFYNITIFLFK